MSQYRVQTIDDFNDPRLAPYRTLRDQDGHLGNSVFVAEGEKVVRRLLHSPHPVISLLLPTDRLERFEPWIAARPEPAIDVFIAPKPVLNQLTGFHLYQGVLALGGVPAPTPLDQLLTLPRPHLFAAMDSLASAENVGLVLRNAAALGVQALILDGNCSHPYLRRSVRICMGTVFKMPYFRGSDLASTLTQLRAHGIQCLAAHPHTDEIQLPDADLTRDTCIVLGSEGNGLRPEVLAACDGRVVVPMQQGVDSLNVGNAAAVFFYEAWRQRRVIPHRSPSPVRIS